MSSLATPWGPSAPSCDREAFRSAACQVLAFSREAPCEQVRCRYAPNETTKKTKEQTKHTQKGTSEYPVPHLNSLPPPSLCDLPLTRRDFPLERTEGALHHLKHEKSKFRSSHHLRPHTSFSVRSLPLPSLARLFESRTHSCLCLRGRIEKQKGVFNTKRNGDRRQRFPIDTFVERSSENSFFNIAFTRCTLFSLFPSITHSASSARRIERIRTRLPFLFLYRR